MQCKAKQSKNLSYHPSHDLGGACNAMQCKAKQSKNLSYLSLDIGANCFSSKLELPTHIQVFKWMEKGVQN
jgi:hypothetical protein